MGQCSSFIVEVDPKVELISNALPGANCGGCGFVGCGEYAEAVASEAAPVTLCAPGGTGCTERLAAIMGVEVSDALPYRAVVHCSASWDERLGRADYRGESTCACRQLWSAATRAAPTVASDWATVPAHVSTMRFTWYNGLAKIDYNNCIGCRACVAACPRSIISMVPFKAERMMVVACSNKDVGNDVKAVCKTGCIGCKACTRNNDLLEMEGNLPVIDYDAYELDFGLGPILDTCRMESLFYIGKPTPEELAAVAHEAMPDRVEADFKTTIDDTQWRG